MAWLRAGTTKFLQLAASAWGSAQEWRRLQGMSFSPAPKKVGLGKQQSSLVQFGFFSTEGWLYILFPFEAALDCFLYSDDKPQSFRHTSLGDSAPISFQVHFLLLSSFSFKYSDHFYVKISPKSCLNWSGFNQQNTTGF